MNRGAEEAHRDLPNEALYGDLSSVLGLTIPAHLHFSKMPGVSIQPQSPLQDGYDRHRACST